MFLYFLIIWKIICWSRVLHQFLAIFSFENQSRPLYFHCNTLTADYITSQKHIGSYCRKGAFATLTPPLLNEKDRTDKPLSPTDPELDHSQPPNQNKLSQPLFRVSYSSSIRINPPAPVFVKCWWSARSRPCHPPTHTLCNSDPWGLLSFYAVYN